MAALSLGVASCGHASPSALDPHGPGSARIAGLWWFMFSVSAAVVVFVGAVILVGILPRRRRRHLDTDATPTWAKNLVVGGGVVFPVVVLSVLWVLTLHDMQALSSPPGRARLEVIVEGYQW
ncbi:MAG TPA: cytochrome C oxidase subunit II, partial [Actinomycetota bacterium]